MATPKVLDKNASADDQLFQLILSHELGYIKQIKSGIILWDGTNHFFKDRSFHDYNPGHNSLEHPEYYALLTHPVCT